MSKLIGEWKCVECSNLEPVMIEIGTHQEIVDHFDARGRILIIDIRRNEVYLHDGVVSRQVGTTFVFGKEIQEMTADGRIVQSVITPDSDEQLTQIQRHGFNETRITRAVSGDKLIMRMKAGDSVAVLKYIRVGEPKDTEQYFTPTEPESKQEVTSEMEATAQSVVS
ncbi:Fatty acid-binding protein type VII [Fasciola hepatica]|uniref:Fatty acid-binding protein type VII n=1 Tax=Fasciola hepatica TaxID=6192 RepID=A0A0U1Z1W6_FASHE|nr:fatty acid-binding protein type VII [Fasciola hepatica]THD21218.1 Fatty acid-binding protein type VII [Fasciola hepatica]